MQTEEDLTPELSIIIPLLNEGARLPVLLADLQRQQQLDAELLFCDGGSKDGSFAWLQEQLAQGAFRGAVLQSPAGRGRQLNHAARRAHGEWLLFLHADSRFDDPLALRKALDLLRATGSQRVAGHFPLRFRRHEAAASGAYYFYQWKARLGRPETIHGDQGFLLRRAFFTELGVFREDLPVMEDTDFAERLRLRGNWLLLPAEISTSARRFEEEGLWQRQLLNAILMCLRSVGHADFFAAAPAVYRQRRDKEPLRLSPYFLLIARQFAALPWHQRWCLWWRCGCYVRNHAWQLLFALDARRGFRQGIPLGAGELRITRRFEPLLDLFTDHPPGRLLATLLLRGWFAVTAAWLRRRERQPPA